MRREEGTTLRDLRSYFSSTPAERSVMNNDAWLHLVRTGITNGGLQVETQTGEVNPPSGYDANWLAWATPYLDFVHLKCACQGVMQATV